MKSCALWAALMLPAAAYAQDSGDLKRELEKRLAEMDKNYKAQRAKVIEDFERKMHEMEKARDKRERPTESRGMDEIMEKIGRHLQIIEERLAGLEKRLHRLEGGREERRMDKEREEEDRPPEKKKKEKKDEE
jgi:hypothetical protein